MSDIPILVGIFIPQQYLNTHTHIGFTTYIHYLHYRDIGTSFSHTLNLTGQLNTGKTSPTFFLGISILLSFPVSLCPLLSTF